MAVHQLPRALRLAAAAAALTFMFAACGDDAGSSDTTAAPATVAEDTTAPGLAGSAQDAACQADNATLSIAVEAYQASNSKLPASQEALVAEGFLSEKSTDYDITPDGSVVPIAGGRCTNVTTNPSVTPDTSASDDTSFIAGADSVSCRTDRATLEIAVEAFTAVLGRSPTSQEELVAEKFLNRASTNHDLGPDGSVVPLASGRCA